MKVVVTTVAIIRVKLLVKSSPPTNQHPTFSFRPDAPHVTQPAVLNFLRVTDPCHSGFFIGKPRSKGRRPTAGVGFLERGSNPSPPARGSREAL